MIDEYAYFNVTGSGAYEKVTEILGWKPSKAWSEGQARSRGNGVYAFMKWQLDSGLDSTVPIEQHIESLLLVLNSKAPAIRNLAPDYNCLIQCVGHFDSSHGLHLRPDQVRDAAHMGIGFSMDFYARGECGDDS